MTSGDIHTYRAVGRLAPREDDADPVTTEIIRHSLNSAANQMKRALVRTAFSPVIYEVLDFAVALYDPHYRLLAQAPTLPGFMGTMNFCTENAVNAVGGQAALEPGDIILYNVPYGTGSHAQDAALIMPVFLEDGTLIGFSSMKGHWLDIGGKDPYSTDTVDVFQEGTIFPGVKIYRRGERVEDLYRTVLANSRVPKMVAGDLAAEVVCVRAGEAGLRRVVERYGREAFRGAVERMFDHGEAVVRSYLERIPDGRYVAHGVMDSNGITDDQIPFEVAVEVEGSTVRIDFSKAPEAQEGPVNCPLPMTVSVSRIAISMLAGASEAPNEGHLRPVEVVTRTGSMFHPQSPSPCFVYGWAGGQSIEVIYRAIAQAMPGAVPAASGGAICSMVWWGKREATGEPWADGSPHPVGHGGHIGGDGATMMYVALASTRFSPVEVWEVRNPWVVEKVELAPDSCGPGQHRGGLGIDWHFRMLEDTYLTSAIERSKNAPYGLVGGGEGRPNGALLRNADGDVVKRFSKATRLLVPKGHRVELQCGGGGGYGPPSARNPASVLADVREGYITLEHARKNYPHAFPGEAAPQTADLAAD